MGFPAQRDHYAVHDSFSPMTVRADWSKVIDRLASHPEEANASDFAKHHRDPHPLFWALKNEVTPITVPALNAFLRAYPNAVTQPRSPVVNIVMQNSVLNRQPQEMIDILLKVNPKHLCGRRRTRTFQLMGFPLMHIDSPPSRLYVEKRVDWQALEIHLKEHPQEASILCRQHTGHLIFPLEAAVQFENDPVPHSTVELLLSLCPEAATIDDSSALFMACATRNQADPEVIGTILKANPAAAAEAEHFLIDTHHERGLPLHEIMKLKSSDCAAQIAPDLIAAYPAALADTSNIYDMIPFQVAVEERKASPSLMRVLLESGYRQNVNAEGGGQLFYTNDASEIPMAELITQAALIRDVEGREIMDIPPAYQADVDRVWGNLCLALQAAGAARTKMSVEKMWEYPLLQGMIEFGEVQLYFDKIFRERTNNEVNQLDPLGRSALAVAIEMADKIVEKFDEDSDNMQLSVVVKKLLDNQQGGSPSLASIPIPNLDATTTSPTFPLHRALHKALKEDVIHPIVAAFPDVLSIPDPATNLIPCLLAAVGNNASVSVIFSLMTQRPNLIAVLCQTN